MGENSSTISSSLPNISPANKEEFPTMESWLIKRFENIKVLEEEMEIDWINFFLDYRILKVSYRDPYKLGVSPIDACPIPIINPNQAGLSAISAIIKSANSYKIASECIKPIPIAQKDDLLLGLP